MCDNSHGICGFAIKHLRTRHCTHGPVISLKTNFIKLIQFLPTNSIFTSFYFIASFDGSSFNLSGSPIRTHQYNWLFLDKKWQFSGNRFKWQYIILINGESDAACEICCCQLSQSNESSCVNRRNKKCQELIKCYHISNMINCY